MEAELERRIEVLEDAVAGYAEQKAQDMVGGHRDRRLHIASLVMAAMGGNEKYVTALGKAIEADVTAVVARVAVFWADALIAELDK